MVGRGRFPSRQFDSSSMYAELVPRVSDPNCGAAYKAAEDDTVLGLIDRCGQANPSIAPMVPTVTPMCGA